MKAFTDQEIMDFHNYEGLRKTGTFNMMDPRARILTGMSSASYRFVIRNYDELKEEANLRSSRK